MFGWGRIAPLMLGGSLVMAIASPANNTSANFNASLVSSSHTFIGATFSPLTAPVVTPTATGTGVHLTWAPVLLSSGGVVSYVVTRINSSKVSTQVCVGSSAPSLVAGLMDCTDNTAPTGDSYTYTEQPFYSPGGTSTWSRPVSAASVPSTPLNLAFLAVGSQSTSTNNGTTTASYGSGSLHDLLLFVSVNNANTAPNISSTGWTTLVDKGTPAPSPFHLFIAWREAPSTLAGTVSFKAGANGTGATTWVVRYTHTTTSTSSPVTATASVASSTATPSATYTPTPSVVTSVAQATVISIVAVRAANGLSLSAAHGFGLQFTDTSSAGSVSDSMGLADVAAPVSGTTVVSPTWAQSGTAAQWIAATVAFA